MWCTGLSVPRPRIPRYPPGQRLLAALRRQGPILATTRVWPLVGPLMMTDGARVRGEAP